MLPSKFRIRNSNNGREISSSKYKLPIRLKRTVVYLRGESLMDYVSVDITITWYDDGMIV